MSTAPATSRRLSVFALLGLVAAGLITSQAALATSGAPAGAFARGQEAIQRLGDRLPNVALQYGMSTVELQRLFQEDSTLAVDAAGRLAYIDAPAPGETVTAGPSTVTAYAPPITGPEFQLASLPGADKTIFLDFDGHVTSGTAWNNSYGDPIVTNPYDTNGNFDTWSAGELATIRDAWAAAAEDFAPWNINVTTIEPPLQDLIKSGTGDTKWGARVVITKDTFAACGCGGFAYVGSFTWSTDTPTFVFNSGTIGMAEAISHEVGHMLGLDHDGVSGSAEYYYGHSSADTPGWAPIMGAGYYQPVTQWSKGDYYLASQTQDDTAIIANATNGFGLRTDDHGDSAATATPFNGNAPSNTGLIASRTDVDTFSFTTVGGAVTFTATPATFRPNLDITLTLRDALGQVVATHNHATQLDASLSANLGAGTYTVEVSALGAGSPLLASPTGFTDYANIGTYTVTGTIDNSGPPDLTPPATPVGLAASASGSTANLSWSANTESDLANYVLQRSKTAGGPYTTVATVPAGSTSYADTTAPQGTVYYVVAARDAFGNTSSNSAEVSASLPYISSASSGQQVAGTSTGAVSDTFAAGGGVQTITEGLSGGSTRTRFDLAEYRWTIPAAVGNQVLAVSATVVDGGDNDSGFNLEWSTNGTTWRRLTTVTASVNTTFPIGAPTGNVVVRVIDTNRSGGNTRLDRINVDFLQITGDGSANPQQPTATKAFATVVTSTASAAKGYVYGVVTVTVTNDLGEPVSGAGVSGRFTGSFTQTFSGTTNSSGVYTYTTTTSLKSPVFSACLTGVTNVGTLTYQSNGTACP
ncbi:MAG: zinc-dependent metalloprotease family protein [Actinomycetota bacterium]